MCTINFQFSAAISYIGVVIGTKRTRTTLFLFKLPEDSGTRDRWFTLNKTIQPVQTITDMQLGKRWIVGLECISITAIPGALQ